MNDESLMYICGIFKCKYSTQNEKEPWSDVYPSESQQLLLGREFKHMNGNGKSGTKKSYTPGLHHEICASNYPK